MIIVAITAVGLGLVFILLGVIVALATEIEHYEPDKEVVKSIAGPPFYATAKVQLAFGNIAKAAIALGVPVVIGLIDVYLAMHGTIR